jgi:hypothetical protein
MGNTCCVSEVKETSHNRRNMHVSHNRHFHNSSDKKYTEKDFQDFEEYGSNVSS